MRFTIFGATGFIGSHLVRRLQQAGHDVLVPSRANMRAAPPEGGHGHVIWAIGLTGDFHSRPFDTMAAHVGDLAPILSQQNFDSFLYLSSTRVYAGARSTAEASQLVVTPSNPSDLYNISKLAGESLCLGLGRPEIRVARLANVTGPREQERFTFLGDICRAARGGQILLRSAPVTEKDYIWIDDAVTLLLRIAMDGQQRIYNVASGRQVRHRAWLEAISALSGCQWGVEPDAKDASFPSIDISRVAAEFGFAASDVLPKAAEVLNG
jgi:nucleoside-diphosphate-sugar epimerase